jgi:radical SAM superfamily enzyme YgiQ (UPF0313 family)
MKIVLCPVSLSNPLSITSGSPKVVNTLALGYLASALKANKNTQNEDVIILEREAVMNTLKTLKKEILRREPDVLGISVYLWNYQRAIKLCEMIKQDNPSIVTVLGGPQVTYSAENVLKENLSVDIIVRGEGEITFCELIEALEKGMPLQSVKGITFRHNNTVVQTGNRPPNCNLDAIPSPYLTNILDILISEKLDLETSRGCMNRCAYCVWHRVYSKINYHCMERVFEELKFAHDAGVKEVSFFDSVFDSPERAKALCTFIQEEGIDLRINIFLNIWSVKPEYLHMLKKSGTFSLDVGIQSMNPETLRLINRPSQVAVTEKALAHLKASGVETVCDIIFGLPADTLKSVKRAIDTIVSHRLVLQTNFLQLLPGSVLYETARHYGLVYTAEPPHMVYQTPTMSKKELIDVFQYGHFVRNRENMRRAIESGKVDRGIRLQWLFDSLFGG